MRVIAATAAEQEHHHDDHKICAHYLDQMFA
jgi:hypothetical protein